MKQRKSPRRQGYDYRQSGAYFATICTHQRSHLFGSVQGDEMVLSEAGEIATQDWYRLSTHFKHIELDGCVVMPNHVHGIIAIVDDGSRTTQALSLQQTRGVVSGSLSAIVGSYKSGVTRKVRAMLQQPNLVVWQGRYHDHVIRSEAALNKIRAYVRYNPALWSEDQFHPDKDI